MRGKSEGALDRESGGTSEGRLEGKISADLERRGVAPSSAQMLARDLAAQLAGRGREVYEQTLEGVALTCRAHNQVCDDLAQSAHDLKEVERLMSSFAGELSKLDETLEVLAAYLRRMRTNAPSTPSHLIH